VLDGWEGPTGSRIEVEAGSIVFSVESGVFPEFLFALHHSVRAGICVLTRLYVPIVILELANVYHTRNISRCFCQLSEDKWKPLAKDLLAKSSVRMNPSYLYLFPFPMTGLIGQINPRESNYLSAINILITGPPSRENYSLERVHQSLSKDENIWALYFELTEGRRSQVHKEYESRNLFSLPKHAVASAARSPEVAGVSSIYLNPY
jgi:hypothetical protein